MYNDHFGLTGRPFQLTPDPRFYFDSATHRKAMAYLGYGLAQGEGFIVVTGEIGSGKTTLVGHLMASIDPARVNAVKIVSTQVEGDDMLRLVAASFGLPTENVEKGQLLERIERFIVDRARTGQRTLLIVDEVQNLPFSSLEELRMLSNFQAKEQAMLQIFLLGQPEFRDRLNNSDQLEQLRQRVIATHHLTSMEMNEVGPYIEHRMKIVNWTGTPRFDPSAFEAIYQHAGGVPRRINTLMTRVLLMASLEKSAVIDAALIGAVIADLSVENPAALSAGAAEPAKPEAVSLDNVRPAVHAANAQDQAQIRELSARLEMLEAKSEEQEAALRRVLGLLIDWVERDEAVRSGYDLKQNNAR
jgi:general secretion pathway protein A